MGLSRRGRIFGLPSRSARDLTDFLIRQPHCSTHHSWRSNLAYLSPHRHGQSSASFAPVCGPATFLPQSCWTQKEAPTSGSLHLGTCLRTGAEKSLLRPHVRQVAEQTF